MTSNHFKVWLASKRSRAYAGQYVLWVDGAGIMASAETKDKLVIPAGISISSISIHFVSPSS